MTHTCKVCGVTSDAAEFYKGVNTRCKECHKVKVRENRKEKAEYYREYDAKRFQEDPRVKARHKRYQNTDVGKQAMRKAKDKWINSNPDKRAAHIILGNAVRDGRKEKPKECEVCGATGRIEGHHHDYALPLDVKWLCRQCHVNEHKD